MPAPGVIPRLKDADYSASRTFFVTFCVKDRNRVFVDSRLAGLAQEAIMFFRNADWYWLLCYCIMPDHIHMLMKLRSKTRSLSRVIATLKNKIHYLTERQVKWQYGYHDRVLRPHESVPLFARYILGNPVRAGLVREHPDYPFCGIVDFWN